MSCNCGYTHPGKKCPPPLETTTTTVNPELCPPVNPCDPPVFSECIYYDGEDIPCVGIYNGDIINTVFDILIGSLNAYCTTTTTTTIEPTTTTTIEPTTTTTSTTTSTTSTTTTTTTTIDPCLNDYYFVCCSSYGSGGSLVIIKPCGYPKRFLPVPYFVYLDETNGTGSNSYNWVVATLSDLQTLGYNGITSVYEPDWDFVTFADYGQPTFIESLIKCNGGVVDSGICPGLITTTTTSTSTTSTTTTTTTVISYAFNMCQSDIDCDDACSCIL